MQWSDKAFVISTRKHGESSFIAKVLTRNHGLYSGLIRGIKKSAAIFQPGNLLDITWKARLEEQLGSFTAEPVKSYSADIITDRLKLSALVSACSLITGVIHEREPHPHLFEVFAEFIEKTVGDIAKEEWLKKYVILEMQLLKYSGFGLDLEHCAASGDVDNLVYVSPKSGRAVSARDGEEYKDKLLKLPAFLRSQGDSTYNDSTNIKEILDGLLISDYFLRKFYFSGHDKYRDGVPASSEQLREKLLEFVS